MLDIGASTTNLAVIEDGEVQHVAVIPMGGTHITNDLAIGLKTDLEIAELVKIHHAALAETGKSGRLSVVHEKINYGFEAEDIHMVVEARVDELFDFVEKELKRIHKSRKLPGGVVIVGGTANIPGIALFAREKLQLASRLGHMDNLQGIIDDIKKPEYITAVGLMQLDMLFAEQMSMQNYQGSSSGGIIDTFTGLLRKFR